VNDATGFSDVVVADEEGIVVAPSERSEQVLRDAGARLAKEESESLDAWEKGHHARVDAILREQGFRD
jgi:4-hydroxy-4-methyl-2-oxoglutarate aldolase